MADAITVHCPSCQTPFPVDPDKVPMGGVNARCSECSEIFRVEEPSEAQPPVEETTAPPPEGPPAEDEQLAAEETVEEETLAEETPGEMSPPHEESAVAEGRSPGGSRADAFGEPPAESPTAEESSTEAGTFEADLDVEAGEPAAEAEEDTSFEPHDFFGGAGGGPAVEEAEEDEAEEPAEPEDADLSVTEEPAPAPEAEAPPVEPETPALEPETPAPAPEPQAPSAEPEAPSAEPEEAPSPRPAFGNRSPEEKAQRLARVLVSDMITYNPKMYEQALDQGTLKEDFEEEIEKSWEEYVEQVGPELANETSHWTDALNEILAGGEQTF